MCVPNASLILRNLSPHHTNNWKVGLKDSEKSLFSKIKTIASIDLNFQHKSYINEYRRIGYLFEEATKNK